MNYFVNKDQEIVLEAVNQYWDSLKFPHEPLKEDKELILKAVNKDGWILLYAHNSLKKIKR